MLGRLYLRGASTDESINALLEYNPGNTSIELLEFYNNNIVECLTYKIRVGFYSLIKILMWIANDITRFEKSITCTCYQINHL